MSTHTPGPWSSSGYRYGFIIKSGIGAVGRAFDMPGVPTGQEANADLMSAAPDLLDALEAIVSGDGGSKASRSHALSMAYLAIAKARGAEAQ